MKKDKQETPEKAANLKYAEKEYGMLSYNAFIEGAKWQEEQINKQLSIWKLAVEKQEARCKALKVLVADALQKSYDKEEVLEQLNLLYSMKNSTVDTFTDDEDRITEKWFEQFK